MYLLRPQVKKRFYLLYTQASYDKNVRETPKMKRVGTGYCFHHTLTKQTYIIRNNFHF